MSLYQLKSQFQDHLRPISNELVRLGASANQVTISAIVLSAGTAYVIATHAPSAHSNANAKLQANLYHPASGQIIWFILPVSLFIRMALNAIDGMMAREHHQASKSGAILNEVGDIVSDSLLIASLYPHLNRYAPDTMSHLKRVNVFSTLTELIAITAHQVTSQRANQGPLGKSDRALELGLIGALKAVGIPLAPIAKPLLLLNQLLLLKTCLNRLAFIVWHYFNQFHPAPIAASRSASLGLELDSFCINNNIQGLLMTNNNASTNNVSINNSDNTDNDTINNDNVSTNKVNNNKKNNDKINKDDNNNTATNPKKISNKTHGFDSNADIEPTKPESEIIAEQSCFNAYDGTAIYYRYWLTMPLTQIAKISRSTQQNQSQNSGPQLSTTLKQVILLHRGHEHSGRLSELGERFAQAGYQVFAWDARGNGRSGGLKDHADSVTELERDLNDFVKLVSGQTGIGIEDTVIVASSIGATLAAAWVHDYAPTIRGMILGTPAIRIRLYIPMAIPALKVARKLGLMPRVSSYVKAQVLTHDKDAQAAYNADPLISGSISSDLLIDTHATGERLLDDSAAITAPTFILCAGKDYVVDKQAEREFYEQLSSPLKRWQLYPDSFHAIFHETNKADIFADCIDFADSLFAQPTSDVDLRHAHVNSPSKDKVDRLAIKPFNPSFAITRLAMQKFGHVSDAIATGLEHGFDSGSSLDKVYANEPRGKNIFGKAVDKFYLSNIGWQGIRIRRQHILELGRSAISELAQKDSAPNADIRVLDIASGNGYYVFDLLKEFEHLTAELRDYDHHNVQVLADKAEQYGLANRVAAIQKDAFNPASYIGDNDAADLKDLKDLAANFDIAIASGVFELFSDNTLVATALSGIYDSLIDQGYLLYTNQPWHPEQEFISKTLNNHRGTDWVMRCRSQAEMDQLVAQAGFKKIDMRIDRFGIFTVSLAIKLPIQQTASCTTTKVNQADTPQ
ncbi:MAG: alpha/beta fold hydrolase [Psychrobacter sp.]|nr:alpha/beta fold hydrolase [Psychrobacter sp.]